MENTLACDSKMSKESVVLIVSIFIAGLCSIIYELLIGTTSSYFLGDSVKQFSMTIGFYMAAMGVGSYASRYINKNLLSRFIALEILLGFVGGISVPVLYLAFAYTEYYQVFMFAFILIIGGLIGLEIPLLTRLMQKYYTLKVNISNILSLDYFGALVATLIFPFILLPFIGTFKSSLFFGMINMIIGFINLWAFSEQLNINLRRAYFAGCLIVTLFLGLMMFSAQSLLKHWEGNVYEDRVVYSKQSSYQHITLTKNRDDIRMFLNGSLQFSSIDEYRYHESLVHIPMSVAKSKRNVLVLGGGDGMAVREILKYSDVKSVVLVDLDPEVVKLSMRNNYMKKLNKGSLENKKVSIVHEDAFIFLKNNEKFFDVIIADLPDPNNVSLSRLYSLEFYKLVRKNLSASGVFLTQATSPFFANKTFWCINQTIKQAGLVELYPYHVNVPSFAEWGFVLASRAPLNIQGIDIRVATRFLDNESTKKLFVFEKDLKNDISGYSTLDNPVVLNYYLNEWQYWN